MSCLVLLRLHYCNSILAGIPLHLVRHLQSVMNAAARLVFWSPKCDHITPHLRQLHWLTISWQRDFKMAVLFINVFTAWHRHITPMNFIIQQSRSKASAFRFVSRAVCSSYSTLNLRRPSFSSRCHSDLEQSSAARHIRADNPAVLRRLLHSLEDILLRTVIHNILSCLRKK